MTTTHIIIHTPDGQILNIPIQMLQDVASGKLSPDNIEHFTWITITRAIINNFLILVQHINSNQDYLPEIPTNQHPIVGHTLLSDEATEEE
jgi:hypothetical protein